MTNRSKWKNPSGTKTYFAWRNMCRRCQDKKDIAWVNYGGRGITVCARWLKSYDNFFADMGEVPDGKSLDRLDTNKGYRPNNCRWATKEEQLNNQRRNVRLTHNGMTLTVSQWAKKLTLRTDTLFKRLQRMPIEKALVSGKLRTWVHGTRAGYESHKCRCTLCTESNNARHRAQRAARKRKEK